ncbi:thermonuclease family protein [Mesomycoplasma ovipneumoniae]|uniref:thermonuclease family protein n=1 Tax=Mesomycoplasma ovipneumoniae TaxID=29562 RepID=UPI0028AC7DCD|nr:thermonuclease family protein [Mesomycoplasma ovipneumoniae]WNM14744.1 thermonuclease family protein [Mesomycoplasma ovipneumoniae]
MPLFSLTSCYDYLSEVISEKIVPTDGLNPIEKLPIFVKNSRIKQGLTYTTFIKSVYDGDTFTDKNGKRFRIFGIDTPELELSRPNRLINVKTMKFHGLRAKKRLEQLILNRWISFEIVGQDPYERIIVVLKNEKSEIINIKMVSEGLAIHRYAQYQNPKKTYYYPEYKNLIDQILKAQEFAKKSKFMLWEEDISTIYGLKNLKKK